MSARFRITARRLAVIFALFTLLAAFSIAPAAAQTAPTDIYDSLIDPLGVIASYYNAISYGEYTRAYNYWESPPNGQSLAQFSAGFAQTDYAAAIVRLPYLQEGAAGSIYVNLATLVMARTTNNTQQFFAGCFTLRKSNVPVGDATEPDPNWHIYDADLQPIASADLSALDAPCENTADFTDVQYGNPITPSALANAYFNDLSVHDYARAYAYWETPPQNQTLAQFTAGFAQTGSFQVYVYTGGMAVDAGAGNTYANLPLLTTAMTTNSTYQFFAGCYTAHHSNVPIGDSPEPDPNWYWARATVQAASSAANALLRVQTVCAVL